MSHTRYLGRYVWLEKQPFLSLKRIKQKISAIVAVHDPICFVLRQLLCTMLKCYPHYQEYQHEQKEPIWAVESKPTYWASYPWLSLISSIFSSQSPFPSSLSLSHSLWHRHEPSFHSCKYELMYLKRKRSATSSVTR